MRNDLHHVAVFVDDMDRALHLFEDLLGFEVAWRLPKLGGRGLSDVLGLPGAEAEIAYLRTRSGGTALELVRIIPGSGAKAPAAQRVSTSVVVSLVVEDLNGLHQRLSEEGWTPFTAEVDTRSPDGHAIKMFCFPLEDGVTIELIEPAP